MRVSKTMTPFTDFKDFFFFFTAKDVVNKGWWPVYELKGYDSDAFYTKLYKISPRQDPAC